MPAGQRGVPPALMTTVTSSPLGASGGTSTFIWCLDSRGSPRRGSRARRKHRVLPGLGIVRGPQAIDVDACFHRGRQFLHR